MQEVKSKNMLKKLDKLFKKSSKIHIGSNSKIVIMSDCHRGAGNNFDNFIKNRYIYEAALNYYFDQGFTYVELGNGDDLWEVRQCEDIVELYIDIFKKLKKYNEENRLLMFYGNHDITKKYPRTFEKCFKKYYDKLTNQKKILLDGVKIYDTLVLKYEDYDIFLLHGHQVDFLNSTIWRISRFLVRYLWMLVEFLGIKDPTSAAKNYKISKRIDKKLNKWSIKNNKMVIAGHTHRPIFPIEGESLYFNVGCCIHPNGITCLEIENGNITLIKWEVKVNKNNIVTIDRSRLSDRKNITNFF